MFVPFQFKDNLIYSTIWNTGQPDDMYILNDKTNSPTTVLNTGETGDIYYHVVI